jgi:hypothetical protein
MPAPTPPSDGILTAAYLAAVAAYINDVEAKIPMVVRKTADETISASTTFQDDNELSIAVEASSTYWCHLHLQTSSGTTPDFKYQFSKPSGATTPAWNAVYFTAAAALTASISGDALTTGGFGADFPVEAWGFLVTSSTAGQFTLQWAQNTSDAGSTTVRAGSALELTKIS